MSSPQSLQIRQGNFFTYAVPQGWQVTEDGQYAVVLVAPDNRAVTIMVGNSGLPASYHPGQFVYEKLMAMQPQQLQLSQPRQANPMAGCNAAWEFDYTYVLYGLPCRGVAKCSIAASYDSCVMVMTAAASTQDRWASYSGWLPQVAEQVSARDGNAFGMRGMMGVNRDIANRERQQWQDYLGWSQNLQTQVTNDRNASDDARNFYRRENLGNTGTWTNPYGYPPAELPTTHNYYWINRQGQYYGTNDPSENPNVGSTGDWVPMRRERP